MIRDPLTGVYARAALFERLDEEVHRGLRYGDTFSLLLLDLDHFKSINDAFGHARGDAVLSELVARVQRAARSSDVLFRYGGDEFVLFLPRTPHEHATVLAHRLLEEIAGAPVAGAPPLVLSASVGVATFPEDGAGAAALFERADARMYEAKRGGRARVVSADAVETAAELFDEGGRLVERVAALEAVNRFLDALPAARRGALRIGGPEGCGRSRLLREAGALARLRGHAVLALRGRPERRGEPLAALREALPEPGGAPAAAGAEELAARLRRELPGRRGAALVVLADDVEELDAASRAVLRALLAGPRRGAPVAVVHAPRDGEADPFPPDLPLREAVRLAPLSPGGLRVWLRGVLRREPPDELAEWLHEETGGLPRAVRARLLHLVAGRLLVQGEEGWTLAEGFRDARLHPRAPAAGLPPLRGLPTGLPPLVGRDGALRQLLRLLRTAPVVALRGPGGVGKTRLAAEAVAEAAEALPDGVAWVALAGATRPAELATALHAVLGVASEPGPDPWAAVRRWLRPRRLLLVLDGWDHAPGCAAALAGLVEAAPDLRVLLTLRGRGQGEGWSLELEGLRIPRACDSEGLGGYAAVQLFRARAAAADPDPGEGDAAAVARICAATDGQPLGLELAAGLAAALSPRDLAHELEAGLEGLGAYLPGAPAEQRRFRAVAELAWRLLPPATRAVARRASLLRGRWDEAAALRVAAAEPAQLAALVERGWASRDAGGRFALHPAAADFAAQRAAEFGRERAEAEAALADHFLGRLVGALPRLRSAAGCAAALAELAAELPNLRQGWRLAAAAGRREALSGAADALFALYAAGGWWAEGELRFGEALAWLEPPRAEVGGDGLAARLRARQGACRVARERGGGALLRRSLAEARARGDAAEEAFCLRWLAREALGTGAPRRAAHRAARAVAAARRAGDGHLLAAALCEAGRAALARGLPRDAAPPLLEATSLEGDGAERAGAWALLVETAARLVDDGARPLAAAILARVVSDAAADGATLARAGRLLDGVQPPGDGGEERRIVLIDAHGGSLPLPLVGPPGVGAEEAGAAGG